MDLTRAFILAVIFALVPWVVEAEATDSSATCANPLPVAGVAENAAPGYTVLIKKDSDLDAVALRIKQTLGAKVFVLKLIHGIHIASLSQKSLDHLRCDQDVVSISHNQRTTIY